MANFNAEFARNDTDFEVTFAESHTVTHVQPGATAQEAAQIEKNKADIERLDDAKLDAVELSEAINDALAQAKESGEFDGPPGKDGKDGKDGLSWIDLGTVDDVMAEMDNLLEDGRYRLWSDDPFCYSVEVERVGDYIGQTYWTSEEGRGLTYFRSAYYNGDEWEWLEETSHVTQDWLNQYALKNHKHRQAMNADFDNWIETFREGQYQINVQAESKSYIVDQFVFNNKPISTIHVCQRYFEISEPWKVYTRHGTTNGNYVLVDWDEWSTVGALTEADKEDIASMVIQQLPIYQGEVENV